MPKQIVQGNKVKIVLDAADPKDKLKSLKKQSKSKSVEKLTQKELADIGKAYLESLKK